VINYIAEREESLSRYSDKLRESVERIANAFGKKSECQICDMSEGHKNHHRYYEGYRHTAFDELPEKLYNMKVQLVDENYRVNFWGDPETRTIYVRENKDFHKFVPKVEVSLDVEGQEFLDAISQYGKELAKLCIHDHEMMLKSYYEGEEEHAGYSPISVLSRRLLKRIVKEGHITQLLHQTKEALDVATEEYKEVSEIAEKFAKALEG